ncbi:MAG: hypothetical protein Alpg2KO_13150 [Alphaproteobacteria bacterium]
MGCGNLFPMSKSPIYLVMLRQPRMSRADEMRSDPFWEFGSFGLTGCHGNNLLHPRNLDELKGARLAFVQGGKDGMKLVHLTPPVGSVLAGKSSEVKWRPGMPFRYDAAPTLVSNDGTSIAPALLKELTSVRRPTWVARFASCYRSRTAPVSDAVAAEINAAWRSAKRKAKKGDYAVTYTDALPRTPPKPDDQRKRTYDSLKEAAAGSGL